VYESAGLLKKKKKVSNNLRGATTMSIIPEKGCKTKTISSSKIIKSSESSVKRKRSTSSKKFKVISKKGEVGEPSYLESTKRFL
jgi:hypothetical protein